MSFTLSLTDQTVSTDAAPPKSVDEQESSQVLTVQPNTEPTKLLPLTAERKLLCLEVLVRTGGNVSKAAELLGTTRQNIHRWKETDPAFAELFYEAIEGGTDNLEQRYYERAMESSDRAAEFLLKARRPEKYREDQQGQSVSIHADIERGSLTVILQRALSAVDPD